MRKFFIIIAVVIIEIIFTKFINAQAYPGFTLYAQDNSKVTYLLNLDNTTYKSWTHAESGCYSSYLLEDGTLMRTANVMGSLNAGGATGMVQKIDWSGTVVWSFTYSSSTYQAHHDICPMPNGNVLMIAWEVKTAAQSVAAGLNHSSSIWPDHIIEVKPSGTSGGTIVWQWHVWDHLIQDYSSSQSNYGVVANHPELLDINVGSTSGDWMHFNGLTYNPELDQIVFSSHNLNELYVIDHSTTTAQAAGHTGEKYGKGGDFLYRWGCPSNYRASGTQVFNVVHAATWIPKGNPGEGHILAFNNRANQPTSMVVEIAPPQDSSGFYTYPLAAGYGPTSPVWSFTKTGFYSDHLGGVQRLPNGNTMVAQSTSGILFEVASLGNTVWNDNIGGEIVRVLRYSHTYAGLRKYTTSDAVINEIMVYNDSIPDPNGDHNSWIEFFNNGTDTLALAGRYLSNDATNMKKWLFPWGTKITPRGYTIVWADGNKMQSGIHCNFTLTGTGGKLFLSNIDQTIVDSITYGQQQHNISFARIPNGTGGFQNAVPTYNALNPITSVESDKNQKSYSYVLKQNYPNPFNPSNSIEFKVDTREKVTLDVFNLLGQLVKILFSGTAEIGKTYTIKFDASFLPSGVYIYSLTSDTKTITNKMSFVK